MAWSDPRILEKPRIVVPRGPTTWSSWGAREDEDGTLAGHLAYLTITEVVAYAPMALLAVALTLTGL